MKIGSFIKNHRRHQKMTLEAVGHTIGLHKSYLSMIENNVRHPDSLEIIKRISKGYRIPLDKLTAAWTK